MNKSAVIERRVIIESIFACGAKLRARQIFEHILLIK